jgi:hypothetical protein
VRVLFLSHTELQGKIEAAHQENARLEQRKNIMRGEYNAVRPKWRREAGGGEEEKRKH